MEKTSLLIQPHYSADEGAFRQRYKISQKQSKQSIFIQPTSILLLHREGEWKYLKRSRHDDLSGKFTKSQFVSTMMDSGNWQLISAKLTRTFLYVFNTAKQKAPDGYLSVLYFRHLQQCDRKLVPICFQQFRGSYSKNAATVPLYSTEILTFRSWKIRMIQL